MLLEDHTPHTPFNPCKGFIPSSTRHQGFVKFQQMYEFAFRCETDSNEFKKQVDFARSVGVREPDIVLEENPFLLYPRLAAVREFGAINRSYEKYASVFLFLFNKKVQPEFYVSIMIHGLTLESGDINAGLLIKGVTEIVDHMRVHKRNGTNLKNPKW